MYEWTFSATAEWVVGALLAAVIVAIAVSSVVVVATRSDDSRRLPVVNPASTAPAPTAPVTAPGVVAIGDSVMEGAKGSLESPLAPAFRVM